MFATYIFVIQTEASSVYYILLICGAVVLFVLFSIAEFMNSVGGQVYLYFWLAVEVGINVCVILTL